MVWFVYFIIILLKIVIKYEVVWVVSFNIVMIIVWFMSKVLDWFENVNIYNVIGIFNLR